jgi:hypothetical protein
MGRTGNRNHVRASGSPTIGGTHRERAARTGLQVATLLPERLDRILADRRVVRHDGEALGLLENVSPGVVLERRIFGPLGMRDTGFVVPREKRARRAGVCGFDAGGR